MRARAALVLGALVALLAVLLVPVNAVSAVDGDEPPVITDASVTPGTVPYSGGTVHVSAKVRDDVGIERVTVYWYEGTVLQSEATLSYDGENATGDVELWPRGPEASHTFQFVIVARDNFRDRGYEGQETNAVAGTVVQQARPNDAPAITDVSVTPRALPAAGGAVTIRAKVADDHGTLPVVADVTPAGASTGAAATRVELKDTADGFVEGTYTAPANTGTSSKQYAIGITATDYEGLVTTVDAGTVDVAAPNAPVLQLPKTVAFGKIRVGTAGLYGFVLRNTAARGTAPVAGTLTVSGADYAFAGTKARTVRYRLAGGARTLVGLTFRPVQRGDRPGTVVATRLDAPTTQTVTLTGRGV